MSSDRPPTPPPKDPQVIYIGPPKRIPHVISPNLDALVEHDERMRPRPFPEAAPTTTSAFVGLPPPPRGPRKTATIAIKNGGNMEEGRMVRPELSISVLEPELERTGPHLEMSPYGGTPNPYINRAPSLESLLEAKAAVVVPTVASESEWDDASPLVPGWSSDGRDGVTLDVVDAAATRTDDDAQATPSARSTSSSSEVKRRRSKRSNSQRHQKVSPSLSRIQFKRILFSDSSSASVHKVTKRRTRSGERTGTGNRASDKVSIGTARTRHRERLPRPPKGNAQKASESVDKAIRSRSRLSPSNSPPTPGQVRTSSIYQSSTHSHSLYSADSLRPRSEHESFIEFSSPTRSSFSQPPDTDRQSSSSPLMLLDRPSSRADKPTKPPLPTTPKPIFDRPSSANGRSSSRRASPDPNDLPPTTNTLDPEERAEILRRNRKLAQVFGKTPGPDTWAPHPRRNLLDSVTNKPNNQRRNAYSVDPGWTTAEQPSNASIKSSQRSVLSEASDGSPLSPDDLTTWLQTFNALSAEKDNLDEVKSAQSTASFIDLSDDDARDQRRASHTASTLSLSVYENTTEEERLEEDRRRKREKLTKLHRFLGSRVPANLALGLTDIEPSLPDPAPRDSLIVGVEADARLPLLRRRRSSSLAALPSTWSDDIERLKEDLDDREKAVNVRRAVKMEKVFGVQPPQTLFHTRNSPSPSQQLATGTQIKSTLLGRAASFTPPFDRRDFAKLRGKSQAESTDLLERLRPYTYPDTEFTPSPLSSDVTSPPLTYERRHQNVYAHYQHSLNSLHDILDRDDRASLAELHKYLNTETPEVFEEPSPYISASSSKAERRRSLPARPSVLSLASTLSMASLKPKSDMSEFQLRRRRAAKLSHFFGVDYRDLIKEILDSIEKGVDDEKQKGTLNPAEAEDLMQKLRNLKSKRASTM